MSVSTASKNISLQNIYKTIDEYSNSIENKFELVILMTSFLLYVKNENLNFDSDVNTGEYMSYVIEQMSRGKVDKSTLEQYFFIYNNSVSQKHNRKLININKSGKKDSVQEKAKESFFENESGNLSDI